MLSHSVLRRFLCMAFLLVSFSGCGSLSGVDGQSGRLPSPLQEAKMGEWTAVADGAERATFSFATSSEAIVILYRFRPALYRWRLHQELPAKSMLGWKGSTTGSLLMVNGVFFHEDFLPSGFFKMSGERIGTRQFDEDKTGIVVLAPTPKILKSSLQVADVKVASDVIQTYPFLLWEGEQQVATDTGKIARRTFMGEDMEGRVYMGVVPFTSVSLYELGHLLKELPIPWRHALNLDGGPSTGLVSTFVESRELIDSYAEVPNVITVEPIPKE